MKKTIAIIITIILAMPQQALCLRPVATKSSHQPHDIFWPLRPGGRYPENPYVGEAFVNRGFSSIDGFYINDISREIERRIKESSGRPVKILLIGAGRGFAAFTLMKKYGEKIDITATAKEDLLYRRSWHLKSRFKEKGIHVTIREARRYIKRLRS